MPMQFPMVRGAQPPHVERARVVIVVGLSWDYSAYLARASYETSIPNGVARSYAGEYFLAEARIAKCFPFVLAARVGLIALPTVAALTDLGATLATLPIPARHMRWGWVETGTTT